MSLLLALIGGGPPPPPPPVLSEIPAGSRRRRVLYFFTIDGERRECSSLADALELLSRAKTVARQRAQERIREAVASCTQLPTLPVPKITASRELRAAVIETRRAIADIYKRASIDIEIAILMELTKRRDDDNDILLLLM